MSLRVLFVHLRPSPFVREDMDVLGERCTLQTFQFGDGPDPGPLGFAWTLVRQFLWLLRRLRRADVAIGWFADYHMVLPILLGRLFKVPVAVVVGGYDAVRLPALGQGVSLSRWRWPLARLVLRRADAVLPVSESLVHSVNRYSEWPELTRQGIGTLVPGVEARVHVLPTGYDPSSWPPGPSVRQRIVTTVGLVDSERRLHVKGIDLLFDAARILPDVRFRVVGVADPDAVSRRHSPPPNVDLVRPVPRGELAAYYREASVYAQLSRSEGLPNVLCEAMLCGCIPVGSRVFGIPDVIGDTGFLVDEPSADRIAEAIRLALEVHPERRDQVRARIEGAFHIRQRSDRLVEVLSDLASGRPKGRTVRHGASTD